jgi:SAM-dependent methyltransferase
MTAPVINNLAAEHPARWSTPVLEAMTTVAEAEYERTGSRLSVIDPFAGVGRGRLEIALKPYVSAVIGIELQPEWCTDEETYQADATALPYEDGLFDAVFSSPVFPNRMTDHHDAKDPCKACGGSGCEVFGPHSHGCVIVGHGSCKQCKGSGLSWRNTYAHALRRHGGEVVPGSAAVLQWGPAYRSLHRRALVEMIRVVVPDGLLAINMSNHIRNGTEQLVVEWWLNEMIVAGCRIHEVRRVPTRRQRNGANGEVRVDGEVVIVAHTPNPRRLV